MNISTTTHPGPSARARALALCLPALLAVALAGCGKGGDSDAKMIGTAKELLAKQETKAAVIELKNAIQKNPKSAEARFLLGKTLLDGGNPVTALVELQKAQELQYPDELVIPELARGMLMVGDEGKLLTQYGTTVLKEAIPNADLKTSVATAQATKGDLGVARESINQALKFKPGYAPAVIVQARLSAAEGDLDGALALLEKVLATEPGNERAGVIKGEMLLQAKRDPDGALKAFRAVLVANPNSVMPRAAVGNILFQQQKIAEAKTEFEQLKKIAPEHPETLYFEAQLAFVDGNLKAAREITSRLLKGLPENLRTLELAGATELRLKNYLLAENHLGHAMKIAPKLLRPRLLLAQTYLRSGQPDKTLEVLQPILESAQPDANSLSLAGEAYLQTGDAKRSEETFARARKAAPENVGVRTSAAIAQLARGNVSSSAIAELESVAAGDPAPRADLALISARLRDNDTAGALKAIDALEKKLPDQPLAHLLRGRVLLLKQDMAGAARSFEAAQAKDPSYFPAVASLAAIDLAGNKPDASRKRFDDFLKAQPKSYQAKLALAELEARTGAPAAKVVGTLKDAAKLNPSEPLPHTVLINRMLASGDGKGALVAAQDAVAVLPENLDLMELLGRAQVAAGDSQRAVSTFKKLASLKPKNARYEIRLAEAYRGLKDNESAARSLKRALELQPDLTLAKRGLALIALEAKRPQDALAIARDMQKASPKDPAGFDLEGEIESARKNWEPATQALRASMKLNRSTETAVRLHSVLAADGKTAEAERLAADWIKESPKDAAFLYYMGDLAMARGDLPAAEARYRSVLELQPANALALNNVAWLMVKQGKPGAVALAEKANGLLPDRAALLDTLSSAQEAENQLPKAIESQGRAVTLQPSDPNLELRLAKLYIKAGDKARARAELETLTKLGDKYPGQAEVAKLLKSL